MQETCYAQKLFPASGNLQDMLRLVCEKVHACGNI